MSIVLFFYIDLESEMNFKQLNIKPSNAIYERMYQVFYKNTNFTVFVHLLKYS